MTVRIALASKPLNLFWLILHQWRELRVYIFWKVCIILFLKFAFPTSTYNLRIANISVVKGSIYWKRARLVEARLLYEVVVYRCRVLVRGLVGRADIDVRDGQQQCNRIRRKCPLLPRVVPSLHITHIQAAHKAPSPPLLSNKLIQINEWGSGISYMTKFGDL